ncbi:hypothetical protein [Dermabacter vaginalis]|uniref:hypothetical protein n=1 Tax=Dermabacter vaginalis TaxID=1630135 RepID=UPI000803C0FC|nr:hypothetical protein [Dermabacter vaginalis]
MTTSLAGSSGYRLTKGRAVSEFYYNTKTKQIEEGSQSPAIELMGPYATREEAQHALEHAEERNEEWDQATEEWNEYYEDEDDSEEEEL